MSPRAMPTQENTELYHLLQVSITTFMHLVAGGGGRFLDDGVKDRKCMLYFETKILPYSTVHYESHNYELLLPWVSYNNVET